MTNAMIPSEPEDFLLYQSEDGQTRVQVRLRSETVWMSLNQMSALFDRDKSVISRHIGNILDEGELPPESVVANFATTAADGKTYQISHYGLDMIIAVGYRVKSLRGTQFRIWATERLREYLIKGFTLDDQRLKQGGGSRYFDELLARIRDIRSSERVFWRKVMDIYATSIDYDPRAEASQLFFKTVQNKIHWAAHGQTAAEVVHRRADADKPNMGLTTWAGKRPRKSDVEVTKNYLSEEEIKACKPMAMRDWIAKLNDFLRISDREILTHLGSISHEAAVAKANAEFEKYHKAQAALPAAVDIAFDEAVQKVKKLGKPKRAKGGNPAES